ncbi:hypothetical protein Cgig2_029693 [Carnegiea gigantea]|uniref:Pentatricopeptide repeat-containing protein n=1 Tax=Carnegiea gigantea TaxID=171969 RepID=A0A9Q1KJV2_9CARY|nr:hypothetical protein Cgig2_029693 [Carnegiea gigantea]
MASVSLQLGFTLQRLAFGVSLNVKKEKQASISVQRKHSKTTRSSLSATQIDSSVLEKEDTEFKSSFDEYLEALESIRADREKKKSQKGSSGHKKKLSKDKPQNRKREESNKSLQSKGLSSEEKDEPAKRARAGVDEEGLGGIVQSRNNIRSQEEKNDVRLKNDSNKKRVIDYAPFRGSEIVCDKSKLAGKTSTLREVEVKSPRIQPFELLEDIQDGPRITQMEMEERIQKLAKWLVLCPFDVISLSTRLSLICGRLFNCINAEGMVHSSTSLNDADVDMPEWMFSKSMRSAKIRFSDHSIMRVIQILGKLGNWRRVLQVVEWLQMQERFKSHKIRHVYTAALDVLGKARRPVEALNLFCAMQRHKASYPDIVAYHSIAVTLGQAGHMRELFDVIDSMRSIPNNFNVEAFENWDPQLEPDIVVYNAVLNACVKRKEWEGALWVLQKLGQAGQEPTSTTYGLVMEVRVARLCFLST